MVSVQLQPPSSFNFKDPDVLPRWKCRFEQFRQASGLSTEGDLKQVSALLYCMDEDAEDTLSHPRTSYKTIAKSTTLSSASSMPFFRVRKNVIFERTRFNRRSQQPDESAEQFITCLYTLAENCVYGDLRDDCIIVGIHDGALSEHLQLDPELTLEKAVKLSMNSKHPRCLPQPQSPSSET